MPRPVKFSEDAIIEARSAFRWYRKRSDRAGTRFRDELDEAVVAVATSPEACPSYVHGTRRFLLRRFPFFVVFRLLNEEIQVVAVAHARRRPGHWKSR